MRHKEHSFQQSHFPPEPLRRSLHSIQSLEELPVEVQKQYSAMKYGDPDAVKAWAHGLTQMLLQDQDVVARYRRWGQVFLASSAYGSVPTAATLMMQAVADGLRDAGWQVSTFHIHRQGGFERTNYGALVESSRKRAMRSRKIGIAPDAGVLLEGGMVVVIDDMRCTGTHERALARMLAGEMESLGRNVSETKFAQANSRKQTKVAALAFLYCISFEGNHKAAEEEELNHAHIRTPDDLLPLFKAGPMSPLLNARLLKFVLLQSAADLRAYCEEIGGVHCLRLYRAALSADGYFDIARFREGFTALEDWLMANGGIACKESHAVRNRMQGKVVAWNITLSGSVPSHAKTGAQPHQPGSQFVSAETGEDLDAEVSLYSRFKFGDVEAIHSIARTLAAKVIATLEEGGSLREMFERAGERGEYVSLTAPGIRNVVSASNFLMREVGLRVNVWLTQRGLPTLSIRTLPRLSSGRANYAELSARQRSTREKTTQTIVPGSEYQEFPSHVIFLDDVEVSGQTSLRARETSLKAGALTFHSIFAFRVDPLLAAQNAAVEHLMNHHAVKSGLDGILAGILAHPDYQPVQRMLRLLLHPRNHAELQGFLQAHVRDGILLRLYLGAMGNDYLWIHADQPGEKGEYAPSILVMQRLLVERGVVDSTGNPF